MTIPRRASIAALAVSFIAAAAYGETCRTEIFEDIRYAVCEVHAGADLRLFLNGTDGVPLGSFERVREEMATEHRQLVFAMNAGMYHPDRSPVGLYIEAGSEIRHIVTSDGPGNFGLLPNGVFCWSANGFSVNESRAFASAPPRCDYATQSGPMLVIDGALHPKFVARSDSRYVRNGVGVSGDGKTAWFAISDQPVAFHEFARLFRDRLATPNALFLDGSISRLYAPELGRDDFGFPMGPMVGLVVPAG
jgi:uncharacterized protein YigE (DUF2233 family)